MASLELLFLMFSTADIRFTIELLQERRLVWEWIFMLRFCYIFYALQTFNFSHFKVQIGVYYRTTHSSGLDWPFCHLATEQRLTIVLLYDGTMASPSLSLVNHLTLFGKFSQTKTNSKFIFLTFTNQPFL